MAIERGAKQDPKRRVRQLLLVLLWVWAVLVFVVVDLFREVAAFDGIRPSWQTYRATRHVAHKMVGEAYVEDDEFSARETYDAPLLPWCPSDG